MSTTFDELKEIRVKKDAISAQSRATEARMVELVNKDTLTAGEERQLTDLGRRVDKMVIENNKLVERERQLLIEGFEAGEYQNASNGSQPDAYAEMAENGAPGFVRHSDPWSDVPVDPLNPTESRGRAKTAIERRSADSNLQQGATATVDRLTEDDQTGVSEYIVRLSNPAYIRAFRKYVRDP